MEWLKKIVIMLGLIFFVMSAWGYRPRDYEVIFQPGYDQAKRLKIAIRTFHGRYQKFYLVVDPTTLLTEVLKEQQFEAEKRPIDLSETNYLRALKETTQPPFLLQNDGLTHALKHVLGVFLTVDLCPTKKGQFDQAFFETVINQRIPLAISIAGEWMRYHPKEFLWLLQQRHRMQVIWVNHANHHLYAPKKAISENFLLTPHTQLKDEILTVEKLLLRFDQSPSVFFRFPGLVSDQKSIEQVKALGLIPLGADAWLAKKQMPQNGSIILVHGNGNEPQGINIFKALIEKRNMNFLPLYEAAKH